MKLNTNSNTYTILYAAVMVIVVAFLLAFVASSLKETQDANVLRDTKNQILTSLNITGLTDAEVDTRYAETITDTLTVQTTVQGAAKEGRVYVASVDGATKYVIPMTGRGLWGGLWGYMSLNEDKKTVYGAYFSHESETAGLGARIKERGFQEMFNGRPVFDEAGEIALTVVKAGKASAQTEVDGITGATLTSNGVAEMVNGGLRAYATFLQEGSDASCCAYPTCSQDGDGEADCCQTDSSEVTE